MCCEDPTLDVDTNALHWRQARQQLTQHPAVPAQHPLHLRIGCRNSGFLMRSEKDDADVLLINTETRKKTTTRRGLPHPTSCRPCSLMREVCELTGDELDGGQMCISALSEQSWHFAKRLQQLCSVGNLMQHSSLHPLV